MGQIVGSLFGDQARTPLHDAMGRACRRAVQLRPRSGRPRRCGARAGQSTITRFESDLAAFFATASQGRLKPAAAETAVRMHIDHLLGQADAYAEGNYLRADQIYRQGYAHAFALGTVLASTLLPPAAATALNSPTGASGPNWTGCSASTSSSSSPRCAPE